MQKDELVTLVNEGRIVAAEYASENAFFHVLPIAYLRWATLNLGVRATETVKDLANVVRSARDIVVAVIRVDGCKIVGILLFLGFAILS
jgi:hypothetical protein